VSQDRVRDRRDRVVLDQVVQGRKVPASNLRLSRLSRQLHYRNTFIQLGVAVCSGAILDTPTKHEWRADGD
jgi:hypothetical protein